MDRRSGDEAASKNENHEEKTKRIRPIGRINAQELWWVSEMLANDCEKRGSTQKEKTRCGSGMHG